MSRLARLDARDHIGFGSVHELVCEAFHAVGQRARLRDLQCPALTNLTSRISSTTLPTTWMNWSYSVRTSASNSTSSFATNCSRSKS